MPLRRSLSLLLLFLPSLALAATVVVDPACTVPGNGSGGYTATCDATAAGNPAADIPTGIAAATNPGDILSIRGVHGAHDGGICPGSATGNYQVDEIRVQGRNGASGNPIIYQNQGFTGAFDSGERVFIEGVGDVSWTQCTGTAPNCNAPCTGLNPASITCADVWWFTGSSPKAHAMACAKADGTPCYRVTAITDLTNAHSNYVSTVCAQHTWIKCNVFSDCPGSPSETCGGSSSEVDSWSDEANPGTIYARWAGETRGPVLFDNNGTGFWLCNSNWITIEGFTFRNVRRSMIETTDSGNGSCSGISDHVVYDKNTFVYSIDTGGSDHHVSLDKVTDGSILNSYFAYSGSESIHTQASLTSSTALKIQGNFIRDNGDPNVLGPHGGYPGNGTPECLTMGDNGGFGDYSGSDVSNNYCLRARKNGLILENAHSNDKVHDNVFNNTGRTGIKLVGHTGNVSNNEIYNNIIIGSCNSNTSDAGIWLSRESSSGPLQDNKIYNNSIMTPFNSCPAIRAEDSSGPAGTRIRNNLLFVPGAKAVQWTNTDATNVFDFNYVYTLVSPAVTWLGTNYSCGQLNIPGANNPTGCLFPNIFNSLDPHERSPFSTGVFILKDAGTFFEIPDGRLCPGGIKGGIVNTIVGLHGFADFSSLLKADCNPDMGADDYSSYNTIYGAASTSIYVPPVLNVGVNPCRCGT